MCVGWGGVIMGVGPDLTDQGGTMSKGVAWDRASSQGYPGGLYITE